MVRKRKKRDESFSGYLYVEERETSNGVKRYISIKKMNTVS